MTGRILHFPAHPHREAGAGERCFSFARVAAECGLGDLDTRTQIRTLRQMASKDGLPLPKNPRYWKGVRQLGPDAIGQKSVWDAAAFLDWQAGQSNDAPAPAPRISHAAGAAPSLRAAMQQRARNLRGRG